MTDLQLQEAANTVRNSLYSLPCNLNNQSLIIKLLASHLFYGGRSFARRCELHKTSALRLACLVEEESRLLHSQLLVSEHTCKLRVRCGVVEVGDVHHIGFLGRTLVIVLGLLGLVVALASLTAA